MAWNYNFQGSAYHVGDGIVPYVDNKGYWACNDQTGVISPLGWIGTTGESRILDAVNLNTDIVLSNRGYHLLYRMYVPSYGGWLPWVNSNTAFSQSNTNSYAGVLGCRGEAFQIKVLDSAGREVTQNCTVAYRAHMQNRGWLSWVFTSRQYASDSEIKNVLQKRFDPNSSSISIDSYSTDAGLAGSGLRLEALNIAIFAK